MPTHSVVAKTASLNNLPQDTTNLILQYIHIEKWIKCKKISRQWYQYIFHALDRIQWPRDCALIFGPQSAHLRPDSPLSVLNLLIYFKVKKTFQHDNEFIRHVLDFFNDPEKLARACIDDNALAWLVMECSMGSRSTRLPRSSSSAIPYYTEFLIAILSSKYLLLDAAVEAGWIQPMGPSHLNLEHVILGTISTALLTYLLDRLRHCVIDTCDSPVRTIRNNAAAYKENHPGVTTDNFLKGRRTHAFFPPASQPPTDTSNGPQVKRRRCGLGVGY